MQAAVTLSQATAVGLEAALVQLKDRRLQQLRWSLECTETGEAILTAGGAVLARSAADDLGDKRLNMESAFSSGTLPGTLQQQEGDPSPSCGDSGQHPACPACSGRFVFGIA